MLYFRILNIFVNILYLKFVKVKRYSIQLVRTGNLFIFIFLAARLDLAYSAFCGKSKPFLYGRLQSTAKFPLAPIKMFTKDFAGDKLKDEVIVLNIHTFT